MIGIIRTSIGVGIHVSSDPNRRLMVDVQKFVSRGCLTSFPTMSNRIELSTKTMADLDKKVAEMNASELELFPGEIQLDPVRVENVWRLSKYDQYFEKGAYTDIPKTWPKCIAYADFNSYWNGVYLLDDGRWLHDDEPSFGTWLTPIEYVIESVPSGLTISDMIDSVAPNMNLIEAVLLKHKFDYINGLRLIEFGQGPDGWHSTAFSGKRGELVGLGPWRFKVMNARGQPWNAMPRLDSDE